MPRSTAAPTRLLGLVLVAVLSVVPALPAPATGAPEEVAPVGVWPLVPHPEVAAGFDPPDDPWGAGHRGVDLLGTPGQPVRAALPGRVSFAGRLAGRGVVVVDHGDTRTTYEPVTSTRSAGDQVAAGAPIGRLEVLGSHCFPRACLHWGWLRGETYLDPLLLVGAGPVRLLPLWRDRPVDAETAAGTFEVGSAAGPLPWADWAPLLARPVMPSGAPAGRPAAGGPW
jgi:murein DD-endopeptidase MepM/ murein hydrolase activator NlpD